ncbi:methyltransferase type 12 [alpha proteobacterium AAP38]|nr:methyltransferase type 12 [alpha proteobacterium AAP38]
MTTVAQEQDRLNAIASQSLYGQDVYLLTLDHSFTIVRRHLGSGSILELGPAEGMMTDRLYRLGQPLTVVEGAERFCREIAARCPQAQVVNSLFETFEPAERFDNIILGHVLEHVTDPVGLLRRARTWLTPGGMIFAAVPNSRSLHRQAGVLMGLLPFEETLNELDLHHGHRRVYNPETFRREFLEAGLRVDVFGGYFMKAASQGQLAQIATPAMIEALCQVGERYPDIAAEIYVVART